MAIIYTYPITELLTTDDTVVITDASSPNKATRTATIGQINALGPQGDITNVVLTMPDGFTVTPNKSNGVVTLDVTGKQDGTGPAGPGSQIQFAAADPPGSTNFIFASDPGLTIDIDPITTRLDVGHRLNPTARGKIAIHSGARGTNQSIGGVLDIEYAYPTNQPQFNQTLATAIVGLIGPEYNENLVQGNPLASYNLQGYNIQLPVVKPSDNTQTTYADSRLLVVNAATTGAGAEERFQSKWISPDDLGIGAGGVNNNVQFNKQGVLDGDNSFNYFVNNGASGAPTQAPNAHELQIGAGGGGLPGMLTLFGDDDPVTGGGVSGILRFVTSTGTDYATVTGPDIQTEVSISNNGTGYPPIASGTSVETQPVDPASTGSGLRVYVKVTNETVSTVSIATQGSGYTVGEELQIMAGNEDAIITVDSIRKGVDEPQIYDIKLPKYAPFEDKIWFGKGTGKNGEITTDDFFKIPLVDFDPGEGHFPGGRLQLTIGSPNQSVNEPWGSILLNGGNNTNESGVIRLASCFNNNVGIMGPKAATPPQGVSYDYDFMLPYLPPEEAQLNFVNGVDTVDIETPGTGHSSATRIPAAGGSGTGCVVNITVTAGAVTGVTVVDFGDNYQENDILTINQNGVPDPDKATIKVTGLKASLAKVLVINENASNTQAFPHETRWIDFPSGGTDLTVEKDAATPITLVDTINFTGGGVSVGDAGNGKVNVEVLPRLSQGWSPFPIYQGENLINIPSGESKTFIQQTVCDVAAGTMDAIKIYKTGGDAQTVVSAAVYLGKIRDASNTTLKAYGTKTDSGGLDGITVIRLNDATNNNPPPATLNDWVPVAGTPCIIVIEVDNSQADVSVDLLGKTGITIQDSNLRAEVISNKSEFDQSNIEIDKPVEDLKSWNNKEAGTDIVCCHFDPFQPAQPQ